MGIERGRDSLFSYFVFRFLFRQGLYYGILYFFFVGDRLINFMDKFAGVNWCFFLVFVFWAGCG